MERESGVGGKYAALRGIVRVKGYLGVERGVVFIFDGKDYFCGG